MNFKKLNKITAMLALCAVVLSGAAVETQAQEQTQTASASSRCILDFEMEALCILDFEMEAL